MALAFAREGSHVVVCDVNIEEAEKTAREIEGLGRQAMALQADVTNADAVEAMVSKALDKLGRIDILVNNAGITRDALLMRMKESDWDLVLSVNLKGAFNCTKSVSKVMVKQRSGKIISIASVVGLMGNIGQANYAASKAGLIGLTKSVAKELASRNVQANAIAPGFIATDMTAKLPEEVKAKMLERIPLARFGEASDVAKAALFLASSDSDYVTGQVVQVDGGMVM